MRVLILQQLDAETPFDGQYDNTGTPYTVTITDNGDGTYAISDVTGGLYGEFYADAYSQMVYKTLPATLDRDGCEIGLLMYLKIQVLKRHLVQIF